MSGYSNFEGAGTRIPIGVTDLRSHNLFMQAAPTRLFHYTSLNGLHGIVKSKSLWLTKAAYLNDKSELKHAIAIFQHEAQRAACNASESDIRELILTASRQLESFRQTNICIASFCEDGDLLSQWRGYGSSGPGVALGFSGKALARVNGSGWARLFRCVYNHHEHNQIIQDLIQILVNSYKVAVKGVAAEGRAALRENLIGYFNTTFLQVAPVLKSTYFSAEREWRIVTLPRSSTDTRFRALVSDARICQYYAYEFERAPSGSYDFLPSVVIGPASEADLVGGAVWTLCTKSNVGLHQVSYSQIPFRG